MLAGHPHYVLHLDSIGLTRPHLDSIGPTWTHLG